MGKYWITAVFFVVAVFRWAGAEQETLTVSAAMSLKNAFEEIAVEFEQNYDPVTVHLNLGASGDLTRQIVAGAPVDVVALASQRDMEILDNKEGIRRESRIDFTGNEIVLILPVKAVAPIVSFENLARPEIERIALGNPQSVPAGAYGADCLNYYHLYEEVRSKLILCEHVRQVLDYTARGEVEAGLVYATDVPLRSREVQIVARAPAQSHQPIVYPIAIVRDSKVPVRAQMFIDWVTSEKGQAILSRYGFKKTSALNGE